MMDKNRWVSPSQCDTGACVEIFHGDAGDLVYIRKGTYTAEEWREFVKAVKVGEYDI